MTPQEMAEVIARAYPGVPGWSVADLEALCAAPGTLTICDKGGLVIARRVLDEAEILLLVVDPPAQRKGQGRALLAALEARCRELGVVHLFLEVARDNAPARALYAGAGFVGSGVRPGYYARPDGTRVDAMVLTRDLSTA